MKKIFSILLIIVLFMTVMLIETKPVYAEEADVDISLEGTSEIEKGFEEIVMTLKIGNFKGIEEGNVMAFEASLEYSSELFSSVKVVEQNDWDVTYTEETGKIVGLVDKGKANTAIAQFVFTVNKNVEVNTEGKIALRKFNISDDIKLDKTVEEISKNITVVDENSSTPTPGSNTGSNDSKNPTNESPIKGNTAKQNTVSEQTRNISKSTGSTDKKSTTTATSKLPSAGLKNMIIIAIVIVAMIGIGSYIRSKTIKLK